MFGSHFFFIYSARRACNLMPPISCSASTNSVKGPCAKWFVMSPVQEDNQVWAAGRNQARITSYRAIVPRSQTRADDRPFRAEHCVFQTTEVGYPRECTRQTVCCETE